MKPLLTTLFLSISFTVLFSQYIPFPEQNATWSMKVDYWVDEDFYLQETDGFTHQIVGDTLIDGLLYSKLYQRKTWWSEDYFEESDDGTVTEWFASGNYNQAPKLIGGLRQDSTLQQVFFIRFIPNGQAIIDIGQSPYVDDDLPLNQEVLLFDFSAGVGDTIYLGAQQKPEVITDIDSVLLNDGIYHKQYHTNFNGAFPYTYIEGVGSSSGLFTGMRPEIIGAQNLYQLNCFNVNDEYLIGTQFFGCDSVATIVPVIEIDQTSTITISPNPFSDLIHIDFQASTYEDYRVELYDVVGRLMIQTETQTLNALQIDTQDIDSGIYFLAIFNGNKLLGTRKMVKTYP